MNKDIRLLVSFKGHRKRKRLKQILGPGYLDHLIDLWLTAAEDRPEGILYNWDETDIALAAGWDGDPDELINAFVTCGGKKAPGFLERLENGDYFLHDWDEHQGWACGSKLRSETARKAAIAKWEKYRRKADAMREHSTSNAPAELTQQKRNAPSPSPSPSLEYHASRGRNSKKRHFKNEVGEYLEPIIQKCEKLQDWAGKIKMKFNPYQWVQIQTNKTMHPQAIDETLAAVIEYWPPRESAWGQADAIILTKSQNYREAEFVAAAAEFKDIYCADERVNQLAGSVFERVK